MKLKMLTTLLLATALGLAFTAPALAAEDGWLNQSYTKRELVTLATADIVGSHVDFTVLLTLVGAASAGELSIFDNAQTTGVDIAFTKSDGVTKFPYTKVRFDATADSAEFWVTMDSLSDTQNTLYVYYDYAGLAGTQSTGAWSNDGYSIVHTMQGNPGLNYARNEVAGGANTVYNGGELFNINDIKDGAIGNAWAINEENVLRHISPTASDADSSWTFSAILKPDKHNYNIIFQWHANYQHITAGLGIGNGGPNPSWTSSYYDFSPPQGAQYLTAVADSIDSVGATWTQLDFVSTPGDLKVYLNGVAVTLVEGPNGVDALPSGKTLTGGKINGWGEGLGILGPFWYSAAQPESFDGDADQVMLSRKARSANWLLTYYNMWSDNAGFHSVGAAQAETVVTVTGVTGAFTHTSEFTIAGANMGDLEVDVDFSGFMIETMADGASPEDISANYNYDLIHDAWAVGIDKISTDRAWSGTKSIQTTVLNHEIDPNANWFSALGWNKPASTPFGQDGVFVSFWIWAEATEGWKNDGNYKLLGFQYDSIQRSDQGYGINPYSDQMNSLVIAQGYTNALAGPANRSWNTYNFQPYSFVSVSPNIPPCTDAGSFGCCSYAYCELARAGTCHDGEFLLKYYSDAYTVPAGTNIALVERLTYNSTLSAEAVGPGHKGDESGWKRVDFYAKQGPENTYSSELWSRTYQPGVSADDTIDLKGGLWLNTDPDACSIDEDEPWSRLTFYNSDVFNDGHITNLDDIYVSIGGPQRVELCNAATWAACTVCEIQQVNTWENAEIKGFLNFGGWDGDLTAEQGQWGYNDLPAAMYMYVIGPDNQPLSTTGLSLVATGPGPKRSSPKWPVPSGQ